MRVPRIDAADSAAPATGVAFCVNVNVCLSHCYSRATIYSFIFTVKNY